MLDRESLFIRCAHPLIVGLTYALLYVPLLVVVIFSFNDSVSTTEWAGFSLRWYKELFQSPEVLEALRASLIVASSATLLSLVLGTCLVIASTWKAMDIWFRLFYINIVTPDIIIALSVLLIFSVLNMPIGYGSIITGHTILGLGFVVPIVRARFVELDPILTEASLDLGATYFQTFRKIIFPLLAPSLIASALLVFTLSLDDFLVAFFCSSPVVQTLSVHVYSVTRSGIDPTVNAISTLFLTVSMVLILTLYFMRAFDQVFAHE